MEPLFPALPEDLAALSEEELAGLISEFETAAETIRIGASRDATDEQREFLAGREATAIMDEMASGVSALLTLRAQVAQNEAEAETFVSGIEELAAQALPAADASEDGDEGGDGGGDDGEVAVEAEESAEVVAEDAAAEVVAEAETVTAEAAVTPVAAAEVAEPVAASAERRPVRLPAPPRASGRRQPIVVNERPGAALLASSGIGSIKAGDPLDRLKLAQAIMEVSGQFGTSPPGFSQKVVVASAKYPFPEDRILGDDFVRNGEKILAVIPDGMNLEALVASGGLCAPLTPVYEIPGFAVRDRPVRDSLPSFRADRGGVTVPTPSIVADADGAITVIEEADDALGGTFATKSCLAQTCPAFTDVAVTIISHCRTFGNLNSRAWPEFVAHEMDNTMAAHARAAEGYLLDRIKTLSVQVTNGVETLGALIYLVEAITRAASNIRYVLRMRRDARFRVLLPAFLLDLLVLDNVQTQFDRFRDQASLEGYLRSIGVEPTWYLDTPATGVTQAFSVQTAGAQDGFPDSVQWAIFPEGEFIHVDGGTLNLGIVRDSTLNETNDYQDFGETFENVARVGPVQGAIWVTTDLCASGQFPPAGTVRTCDAGPV